MINSEFYMNLQKAISMIFHEQIAIHFLDNDNYEYDVPDLIGVDFYKYRIDYVCNTFPYFVYYLVSNDKNRDKMIRFFDKLFGADSYGGNDTDNYPDNSKITVNDIDMTANEMYYKLMKNMKLFNDIELANIDYLVENLTESDKRKIGAIVNNYAAFVPIIYDQRLFHEYRNILSWFYRIEIKTLHIYQAYKLNQISEDEYKRKSKYDVRYDKYDWFLYDNYDEKYNTGYTAEEYN